MGKVHSLKTMSRVKIGIGAAWMGAGALQLLEPDGPLMTVVVVALIALMTWVMYCNLAKKVEKDDEMSIAHRHTADSISLPAIASLLGIALLALVIAGMQSAGGIESMEIKGSSLLAALMGLVGVFYLIPEIIFTMLESEGGKYAED